LIQPPLEDGLIRDAVRFSGQNDENRLRDFLGGMGTARVSQCRGINQVYVPGNQSAEGDVGTPLYILPG